MTQNCSFYNPVTYTGTAPTTASDFWNFASSTCDISTSTSTAVSVNNTFTGGEVVASVFLFLILTLAMLQFLHTTIRGQKIKNI